MASFTNCYYKRTAGTSKPCYVCYRPTTTVLSTANTVDWVYTCDGHLKDPGFASPLDDGAVTPAQKAGLSAEEIAQVTKEWEERQKRKQQKAKEKEKEDKGDDKKDDDTDKDKNEKPKERDSSKSSASASPKPPGSAATSPSPTPSHAKYALHRDVFAMRQHEHRKRRQAAQAKELAPRLPSAPMSALPKP
ncbi:DUF1742-domain-containing protein [Punctularia strigosozonata HHB-11173 SS5]|uniref:DUF1742-domain-containing protein n=1 Tax=Punctularia strigosozonata (strain HHB-11173) TaxID=741275 RepID=UPI0004416572|nr:DUF1742-domain-containing protein [Punctularia strigosozonata HHB-11173 SS5]EIN10374.1 DUF1742-domain-containing protein [Punctularia strigosozonata HHB-11173 SS5]